MAPAIQVTFEVKPTADPPRAPPNYWSQAFRTRRVESHRQQEYWEYYLFFCELVTIARPMGAEFAAQQFAPDRLLDVQPIDDSEAGCVRTCAPSGYIPDWEHLPMLVRGVLTVGGSAVALALLKTVKELLLKWIESASNRSVTVKYRDVEVSIKGTNDLEQVILAITRLNTGQDNDTLSNASAAEALPVTEELRGKQPVPLAAATDLLLDDSRGAKEQAACPVEGRHLANVNETEGGA